jgi:CHAD domain-containing protein
MNSRSPAGFANHLAEQVGRLRRRCRKRLARCRKDLSEPAVHDLRIETRRMLALLDLLRVLDAGGPLKKLRKTIKRRLDAFDELRDTHVHLALLKQYWKRFPESRKCGPLLWRREVQLTGALQSALRNTDPDHVERRLKTLEKHLHEIPSLSRLSLLAALNKAFREVTTRRRRLRHPRARTIHRLRVAFKHYRYMSELMHGLLPGIRAETCRRMQAYQARMGRIQDVEALLAWLRGALANGRLARADARGLRRELWRRRREHIGTFLERLDELDDFRPPRQAQRKSMQPPARP